MNQHTKKRKHLKLMKGSTRLLHIYAQYCWHSDCRIVGNKNALVVLRDAIDEAIRHGKAEANAMAADGEGYLVKIVMCDATWESDKWLKCPVPYTADHARTND